MIGYLQASGTQRMVGEVLRENEAMHDLALSNGLHADPVASDGGTLRYVLKLEPSNQRAQP